MEFYSLAMFSDELEFTGPTCPKIYSTFDKACDALVEYMKERVPGGYKQTVPVDRKELKAELDENDSSWYVIYHIVETHDETYYYAITKLILDG